MKRFTIIFVAALVLSGSVLAGSIYKCVDAAGNVNFSQSPCPVKAGGSEVDLSEQYKSSHTPSTHSEQLNQGYDRSYDLNQSRSPKKIYDPSPVEQLKQLEAMKRSQKKSHHVLDRLQRKKCNFYKKKLRHYRSWSRANEEQEIYWLEKIEEECK